MSIGRRELLQGLENLGLGAAAVVVHASLRAFGQVEGGAGTVAAALEYTFPSLLTPAFTYKTMIIPGSGSADNALAYGSGRDANRMAEFFTADMPVDPLIGGIPEALRRHPLAERSQHPILSFSGIRSGEMLEAQTMADPFAPLKALEKNGGWVLLLGVNQTVNTSIHAAESLAGQKTFTRWALTPAGVVACPSFPGCSAGFEVLAPQLEIHLRRARIGAAVVQAVPLTPLFEIVIATLKNDPLALLCQQEDCERCNQLRLLAARSATGT